MTSLTRQCAAALRLLLILTVALGLLYPATVYAVGRVAAPGQADGSLVRADGRVVGSSLLGQDFTGDAWFHGRPSTSDDAGATSGGSNLAQSSTAQRDAVAARSAAVSRAEGSTALPPDALTASASGLDPDISPAYARLQVARVARTTGLSGQVVTDLVERHTKGRALGFLGAPRVNVLELNLALSEARR